MATNSFLGTAIAVAQESRATPVGPVSGDVFQLKINGVVIATATADASPTVAEIVTALTTSWNASTHPYAQKVTASDQTTYVKLLSDVEGLPFVVTSTVTGTGTMANPATQVASAGPNHWGTATNWSLGTVPGASDTVELKDCAVNICWDLDQSAVTIAGFNRYKSFTGRIGLDYTKLAISADGTEVDTDIGEYRENFLKIKIATGGRAQIGLGEGTSPGRELYDFPTNSITVDVFHTGRTADVNRPSLRLKTSHSSSVINVWSADGGCGIATEEPGETATVGRINVQDRTLASRVTSGSGLTVSTEVNVWGGTNVFNMAAGTKFEIYGGHTKTLGNWALGNSEVYAGEFKCVNRDATGALGSGTLSLLGGLCDISEAGTVTYDTLSLYRGAKLIKTASQTFTTVNLPTDLESFTLSISE